MVRLTIDAPKALMNANHRKHWATRAKETRSWKQAAIVAARAAKLEPVTGRVHVTAIIHRRTLHTADVGNFYPTVKAIIDGLTHYGLWPDDSDPHVEGPDLRAGDVWPRVGVEIIIRPAAPLDLTKVALLTDPGFLDHAADLYTKVAAAAGTAEPIPRDTI